MRALHRIFFAGIVAVASFTGTVAAQTVVVGTGDPDIDIAAVQAAVDRGGAVALRGRFSFDNPPTRHGTLPDLIASNDSASTATTVNSISADLNLSMSATGQVTLGANQNIRLPLSNVRWFVPSASVML